MKGILLICVREFTSGSGREAAYTSSALHLKIVERKKNQWCLLHTRIKDRFFLQKCCREQHDDGLVTQMHIWTGFSNDRENMATCKNGVCVGVGMAEKFKGQFVFLCHKFRNKLTCVYKQKRQILTPIHCCVTSCECFNKLCNQPLLYVLRDTDSNPHLQYDDGIRVCCAYLLHVWLLNCCVR